MKNLFSLVNDKIENITENEELTPEEAEEQIKVLDNIYKMYSALFSLIESELDNKNIEIIRPEYNRLIDNFEDFREGLELYTDLEAMQSLKEIANVDYSNFIDVTDEL